MDDIQTILGPMGNDITTTTSDRSSQQQMSLDLYSGKTAVELLKQIERGPKFSGRSTITQLTVSQIELIRGYDTKTHCSRGPWTIEELQDDGNVSEEELAGRKLFNFLYQEDLERKNRYFDELSIEFNGHMEGTELRQKTFYELVDEFALKDPLTTVEICRAPITCTQCKHSISPSAIMTHFLINHTESGNVRFAELYQGEPQVQRIAPKEIPFHQVTTLTLLAYGGPRDNLNMSLINQKLAIPNKPLPMKYEKYGLFTPILMVVYRTLWLTSLSNADLEEDFADYRFDQDTVWILWFVTAQMLKPFYLTVTAYDKTGSHAISRTMRVRSTSRPQHCRDFMQNDNNYMQLRFEDVKTLTNNFKDTFRLEIYVDENTNSGDN